MSALQFSRSWHIWRGSLLPYRYSFCWGFREHGPSEEEMGHLSTRPLINRPDNEARAAEHSWGVARMSSVPQNNFQQVCFAVRQLLSFAPPSVWGGWSSDLLLITWSITSSRLCNFQLHHNPLVSCRRVAEPHNSSIWSTDIRGNLSACTALKVEDPINRKTGSTNPVRSAQSTQMN